MPRRVVTTGLGVFVITALIGLTAAAAPVAADLTTWTEYNQPHAGSNSAGNGLWVITPGGTVAAQMVNARPTFLASPEDANGYRITASVFNDHRDNDFVGFAVGFSTDPSDPTTDYLLIDWKKGNQNVNWGDGTGTANGSSGLAVSRVTGVPTLGELWGHVDSAGNPSGSVTELARGTSLGSTGWTAGTVHDFVIEYTTETLDVWVDGSHEISLSGSFPPGPFALYNFSQPSSGFSNVTFEKLNEPPTVVGAGADDVVTVEGSTGTTAGAFEDPNGDALTLSCSGECLGFTDEGGGAWSWSQVLPEGPFAGDATITASDGEFEVSDTFDITVHNLAPEITSTSGVPTSLADESELAVWADFTDAGVLDTHIAVFDWGDGTSSAGIVTEAAGSGVANGSHMYSDPGWYVVTVTVWDDDGASDTAVLGQLFVFDPDDFVTGGGWVYSPQGALIDDPGHKGKTTFGFVAKYSKDGSVQGSLQVNVHKGINFHATSLDTLLIADGVAHFSGWGRLDGAAGYSFEVVATDERLAASAHDLFWIEINGPGGLVYGGPVYPTGLPIVGKGIQVHDRP